MTTTTKRQRYDWIEIKMRPKKDGLHESGFRFIRIVGVWIDDDGKEQKEDLHQQADVVQFEGIGDGKVNVDFSEDGVMRVWGRQGLVCTDGEFFYSTATFQSCDSYAELGGIT